jgi:hypothetical protein
MTSNEKLIDRFIQIPSDFTFQELERLLKYFGYEKKQSGKTAGSSVHFIGSDGTSVSMHRPHPSRYVKKPYLRAILKHLKEQGHLS